MHKLAPTMYPTSLGNSGLTGTSTRVTLRVSESVSLVDESILGAVFLGYFHLFWPPSGFKYVDCISLSIL